MYVDYVSKGITCGGPGDAMQNPDSESAYAMLESFAMLYEKTGDKKWLQYAREMAAQFSTWVMSYDYAYSDNCLFGMLTMKTTGAVFANTQNKHGSPGICTHSGLALLRFHRILAVLCCIADVIGDRNLFASVPLPDLPDYFPCIVRAQC